MEKCFNIAGPCFPDEHYMLPALERLPGILRIVERRNYFVLHAARQSGKTTILKALVAEINRKGAMNALYFTVESVQRFTDPRDGIPKKMEESVIVSPICKLYTPCYSTVTLPVIRYGLPAVSVYLIT